MQITIPGNPIPKARARTFRVGKKSTTYDPQCKEKRFIQAQMINELNKMFLGKESENLKDAIKIAKADFFRVDMEFHMPIPKSSTKGFKSKMAMGGYHNKKPDITNLAKFYEDCANGILFKDDSQIVECFFKKTYSENPKTVITITELKF